MNCDARQDSLFLHALGDLKGPELEELRAHLQAGCPACEGRLAEARTTLALLPLSLPQVQAPSDARRRLMEQIGASQNVAAETVERPMRLSPQKPARSSWWVPGLIGAAAAACVAFAVSHNILSAERRIIGSLRDELAAKDADIRRIQASAKDAQDLKNLISLPQTKIMALGGTKLQPNANARLVWDPSSRSLCLYCSQVKALPPGMGYELWLINNGGKPVPAGVFQVENNGTAALDTKLAVDVGTVMRSAITMEPYNGGQGMPQPTGNLQLTWNMP